MNKDSAQTGQPSRPFDVQLLLSAFVIFLGLLMWVPSYINHSTFGTVGMVLSGVGAVWLILPLVLVHRKNL